jgi:hypothetical protein
MEARMLNKIFIKDALENMKRDTNLTVSIVNEKFFGAYVGTSLYTRNIEDFEYLRDNKYIIGLPMGNGERSSVVFRITAKGKKYLEEVE